MTTPESVLPVEAPAIEDLGPAMQALSEMQRKFVVAFVRTGGRNAALAARAAGYSDRGQAAKVSGHKLAHNPKVIAALREYGERQLDGSVYVAITGLVDVASDPKHRDRFKACADILDRTGFARMTRHEVVSVNDERSTAELMAIVAQYASQTGRDPKALLGPPDMIEGEFESPPGGE
jgi:phage terminase small subunit